MGSASCILQGGIELSEGSARVPLRSIHPTELRSFGSRSRGRGRPRSGRAFRQLHSGRLKKYSTNRQSNREFSIRIHKVNRIIGTIGIWGDIIVLFCEQVLLEEDGGGIREWLYSMTVRTASRHLFFRDTMKTFTVII